jgi:type I restriction enzyme S subunit
LSDVDALLGGLDRLIAKKRDLKQAAMQQLLTGQTRLPGFSGEWKPRKFSELLKYERPDQYIISSTEYEVEGDTPVLTANKSFVLGYTSETFGVFDSLPVIIFDDFTTDSKYVEFPFKVKSSAIKILKARSPEAKLKFVAERMRLLRFPVGEHKRYYISEYQHVELPTPEPDEQTAIATVLSDMDAELAALEARRAKTRDLKQAMMQELLSGKTRLVKPEAAHA